MTSMLETAEAEAVDAECRRLAALRVAETSDNPTVASAREVYSGRRSPLHLYLRPAGHVGKRADRLRGLLCAVSLSDGEGSPARGDAPDLRLLAMLREAPRRLQQVQQVQQVQQDWRLPSARQAVRLLEWLAAYTGDEVAVTLVEDGRFATLPARRSDPLTTKEGRVRLAWTRRHPVAFYARGGERVRFRASSWEQALDRAPHVVEHMRRQRAWLVSSDF